MTETPPPAWAPLTFAGRTWEWGRRTYVMAILNATPDSFSGDGLLAGGDPVGAALRAAEAAQDAGADILDLGAESTRPGAEAVDAATERRRLVPILKALREGTTLPVSVDTSKAEVAAAVLDEGAAWINDVWGLLADEALAGVVARAGVPIVLMHNRPAADKVARTDGVGSHYEGLVYADLLEQVGTGLQRSVDRALQAGIERRHILLDPGIGFGKTAAQNLELLDRLGALRALGHPLLVGTSRKSFIGLTLDLPPEERLEGTAATVAIAIARGADIVRVHDVAAMVRVARMTDAIVRRG